MSSEVQDGLRDADAIAPPVKPQGACIMRRSVAIEQDPSRVTRAELVATAHGVYEASVNGRPVSDSVLQPGWTAYDSRVQVSCFDVTEAVRQGGRELTVEVLLGRGWWAGDMGPELANANYGDNLALLAVLELTFADGATQRVVTDESWTTAASPITFATIYDGQHEDRRIPATESAVALAQFDRSTLVAQVSPHVRRHEIFRPTAIWTSPAGKTLVDFGQNLAGWVRLTVTGPAGTEIVLRHAEVLEHDELGTRQLRGAAATDRLILDGAGRETFEPTFTYHGFRYVEVTGWPGELTAEDIEAVVVHSDMRATSSFECSHPLVTQLVHNSVWSQKANFLSIPTDCPQRNERLGWTGDIAAYATTAAFQFDVADFLHSWLLDLAAETRARPNGSVPCVVPDIMKHGDLTHVLPDNIEAYASTTAMWGDAAVWVPQALWNAYGDQERLREQYPGMVMHLESAERALSPSGLWDTGYQFADWLDPDSPPDDPVAAKADKGVVSTACLIRSARFAANAAHLLGEDADSRRWLELADRTLSAFTGAYVSSNGTIFSDCATVYALAIAFDLLDEETRVLSAARLAQVVREAGYKISTGFAGTPFVTWALSETGYVRDAYRLLLEEECPSWLYPVKMGATTIWERWDSMLPDGSVNPGEMTGFNHYALGAVADWVYQVVLGIRAAEPGYRRIRVQPTPGPGIEWAKGSYDSVAGRIEVSWAIGPHGEFSLEVSVPDGVETDVVLPDGQQHVVVGGRHQF